jgi:NAD(P)-dependent dehydrogenase (short-subunit alcohol dehydrogenase family)
LNFKPQSAIARDCCADPSNWRGLGALVAEKFAAEGCHVAINYVANHERARDTARKINQAFKTKAVIIQGVRLANSNIRLSLGNPLAGRGPACGL